MLQIKKKKTVHIHNEGKVHKKKVKKLTSVTFAFTHTYTLEKLTLLLFAPKRTSKILKNESIAVWWKGSKQSLKGQCALRLHDGVIENDEIKASF